MGVRQHGAPEALVTDNGRVFLAKEARRSYQALGIAKRAIDPRQSWQSYIASACGVQRRVADWAFVRAGTWPELLAATAGGSPTTTARTTSTTSVGPRTGAPRPRPGGRDASPHPLARTERTVLAPTMATVILLATIALIVARPRGLGEGGAATLGAGAMLLLRLAGPADVWAVVREVAGVLLFLLGMMALTAAVAPSGLFDLLAVRTARAAHGSGYALFAGVFGLGAAITALLSLDVTVLILTPVVYALATRLRLNALPYLYACTFVANTGSLLLPISNLTNLLVYGLLGLGFARFAATMLLPQIVALVVNLAVLFVLFRAHLPRRFDRDALTAPPANADPTYLRIAAAVLGATLLALLACGLRAWPIYPPALAGGALLLTVGLARRRLAPRRAAREISWGLFPFVIGMFTVIRAAEAAWLPRLGGAGRLAAHGLPALLVTAFGTAVGANLVNNVPIVAGMIGLLGHAEPAAREPLALATLLGANLGPVVTPFGSLATLLWLTIVRRQGEAVSTLGYMKVGALVAPPVLLAATLALWLVLR